MPEVRIVADPRTEFGKGGARRTRRAGRIPAVLYGHGTDTRHIALPTREFEHALRTDGANVLLEVQLDGTTELALPKAIQRDPVRGGIEHIDLILVRRGERMSVDVTVTVTGDIAPGGLLEQAVSVLAVSAEATNIPGGFEVPIDGLAVGDSIHARDVSLPPGVELTGDPEQLVVHILPAPTAEELEADLAGAEAELGAGQTGAAAEEAAKVAAEGEAAGDEPTGEGDIVPDTDSGGGGPSEGQTNRE